MPSNQSSIVTKCGQVLDLLADAGHPLSFTEIQQRSGMVKSSTHRILAILTGEGLAEQDARTKAYRLGPRLIGWALTAWRSTDLLQVAEPELEALAAATGVNVALAIRDAESVLFLRTIDRFPVRYAPKVGEHAPLHCTAVGKTMIAFLPAEQRSQLLDRLTLERYTEHTLVTLAALEADLAIVRRQGYATSDREEFLQVCGIAAPIHDSQGALVAAICLWAPVGQSDMAHLSAFGRQLCKVCEGISTRLGQPQP